MSNLRNQVAEKVKQNAEVVNFYQERPNTFIEIRILLGDFSLRGAGFSKVNWSDEWDVDFGRDLAFAKAVHNITRQILSSPNIEKYLERLEINQEDVEHVASYVDTTDTDTEAFIKYGYEGD